MTRQSFTETLLHKMFPICNQQPSDTERSMD
jgi:hypothetical protein